MFVLRRRQQAENVRNKRQHGCLRRDGAKSKLKAKRIERGERGWWVRGDKRKRERIVVRNSKERSKR